MLACTETNGLASSPSCHSACIASPRPDTLALLECARAMMFVMRKHLGVAVLVLAVSGCYVRGGGGLHIRAHNPLATVAAIAVTAAVIAASTPPPIVASVEYYDYGHNPGHIWVNGRHTYVNGAYTWQAGYWQPERQNHYWIQGHWAAQGNQYVWVDGQWAAHRQGYVYADGYWDYRNNGYVWMPGTWQVDRPGHIYVDGSWTVSGGRRSWVRGGWQVDDGRPQYNSYRARHGRGIQRRYR